MNAIPRNHSKTAFVDVDVIESFDRARLVKTESVKGLATSMAEIGLRTPISIRYYEERPASLPESPDGTVDGYVLVSGAHRLAAAKLLGWNEIEAFVHYDGDENAIRLWEIDENLCRNELSPAERASQTLRRKQIYEEMHGRSKAIGAHAANAVMGRTHDASAKLAVAFTSDTAAATGKSERVVQRDAERGSKVIAEVIDIISGTPLDTGIFLDTLKKLSPNDQVTVARRELIRLRERDADARRQANRTKIDVGVKTAAAKEVAEIIAAYVPAEWWDTLRENLGATDTSSVVAALVTFQKHAG